MVGDVGDDEVSFLIEQLTRVLSARSKRTGARTVLVVPIDQRTLDAARVVHGDLLESKMAEAAAKSVGAWRAKQDRLNNLVDERGRVRS